MVRGRRGWQGGHEQQGGDGEQDHPERLFRHGVFSLGGRNGPPRRRCADKLLSETLYSLRLSWKKPG